jgi:outer membrane protein assembly factor BamB
MDMEGNVLHEWRFPFSKAWPTFEGYLDPIHSLFWRRAYLYKNGDVLAIFEGIGMIKIDRNSKLLWKSTLSQHHDVTVTGNGDIYTLTRKRSILKNINPKEPIVADYITVLRPNGKVKKSVSLVEAIQKNPAAMKFWDIATNNKGDVFHTNSVRVLDNRAASRIPDLKAGHVLVSSFILNAVLAVDLKKERVVWSHSADYLRQHDAQILPNGNMLLLDNRGGNPTFGWSRILEYAPPDMKQVWAYEGTEDEKFGTYSCGAVQRLYNGNSLITETDNGRAFEITAKGDLVWEFISPHRAGEDRELVASLFDLQRISPSYVPWLKTTAKGDKPATPASR